MSAKTLLSLRHAPDRHWVGDGFPVHGLFGYSGAEVAQRSPFLLLDYAPPYDFAPIEQGRRGVGAHPHRGFETVTIVYSGEVEHRDSTGAGGVIGPGEVQWMTAGAGLLHEEFHTQAFSRRGGVFEVAQLWVNLPAADKMTSPRYQAITRGQIPEVALPEGGGQVRVIAGGFAGTRGPASTHTPMNVWDVRLAAGSSVDLAQPDGWNTLVVVLSGAVRLGGGEQVGAAQVATLSAEGSEVNLQALTDTKLLLLAGEPIDEPVVGYGPFVMNTEQQIRQAMLDFSAGRFGRMG